MTQVHDIGIPGGGDLFPPPVPLRAPVETGALRYEAAVVRAALNWFRVMLASGSDLDPVTLGFVYGRDAAPAALDLMDACHDVEDRRSRSESA